MTVVGVLLLAVFVVASAPSAPLPSHSLPVDGGAFRIAVGDLAGDGRDTLIYATYDGRVVAADAETAQQTRWSYPFNSFPTGLLLVPPGEVTAGEPRVYVCDVDGGLAALAADGSEVWRWHSPQALHGVVRVRLPGGGAVIITGGFSGGLIRIDAHTGRELGREPVRHFVQRLAAGDLDGDGADELVVADHRENLALYRVSAEGLHLIRWSPLFLGDEHRNWESPGGTLKVFSLAVGDLDRDGRGEILAGDTYFNTQAVLALAGDGGRRWLHAPRAGHDAHPGTFYSTAFVHPLAPADAARTGAAVVVVHGNRLRLLAADGALRGEAAAEMGFTDVTSHGGWLYLGSSPNGDRTVYRLPLDKDLPARFGALRRHGLPATMGRQLAALREAVSALPPPAVPPERLAWQVPLPRARDPGPAYRRLQAWVAERFPGAPVDLFTTDTAMEKEMPRRPDGRPWNERRWALDTGSGRRTRPVAELVALAQRYERAGVPVVFYVGHTCTPFITVDTARRLAAAAPSALRGFYTSEDEGRDDIPPYIRDFHAPVGDVLAAMPPGLLPRLHVTTNKNVWWLASPTWPEVFAGLFGEARGRLLAPKTEDSNSRTPELNLLARFGLRQAGLVDRLFTSHIEDLNSFNRMHQLEYPLHGHPVLRYLVVHTLLGAKEFAVRGSPNLLWSDGEPRFSPIGEESTAVFLSLLAKGLVHAPAPEDMARLLPLGFRMHPPPEPWLADALNGHQPSAWRPDASLEGAVLPHNGANWGMTRTPPHALTAVLLGKRRQFGSHIPATPYGQFVFVPAHHPRDGVAGVTDWWETDGVAIWREGAEKRRLTGEAAAAALRTTFAEASRRLPFGVSGDPIFLQAARLPNGGHRLWLIDPGWWDPADRAVQLHVRLPGHSHLRDAITGERIPLRENTAALTVPAGLLRILDAIPD